MGLCSLTAGAAGHVEHNNLIIYNNRVLLLLTCVFISALFFIRYLTTSS